MDDFKSIKSNIEVEVRYRYNNEISHIYKNVLAIGYDNDSFYIYLEDDEDAVMIPKKIYGAVITGEI